MREIKFRAWDTVSRDMSVAFELDSQGLIDFGKSGWPLEHIRCLPGRFILMQFTGLLDKSGKEICEGDLVRYGDEDVSEIVWAKHVACFQLCHSDGVCADSPLPQKECEIIGNIYENPDLLTSQ